MQKLSSYLFLQLQLLFPGRQSAGSAATAAHALHNGVSCVKHPVPLPPECLLLQQEANWEGLQDSLCALAAAPFQSVTSALLTG